MRLQNLAKLARISSALLCQRNGWRIQIQPDDVAYLSDEQRIGGELERLAAMRLQTESSPRTTDGAWGYLQFARQQSSAPVGGFEWALIEGRGNQLLDLRVAMLARCAGPRLIEQSVDSTLEKAATPLAHRLADDATAPGYCAVVFHLRARQDDPRTQRQSLRGLMSPCPLEQLIVSLAPSASTPAVAALYSSFAPRVLTLQGDTETNDMLTQ